PSADVSFLEARADLTQWPIPGLALIRGTALDAQQFVYYDAVLYPRRANELLFQASGSTLLEQKLPRNAHLTAQNRRHGTRGGTVDSAVRRVTIVVVCSRGSGRLNQHAAIPGARVPIWSFLSKHYGVDRY